MGTDLIKFGYSDGAKIKRRLDTLQTGCPYELELLALCAGDMKAERTIHHRLFQANAHHRGEWFRECDAAKEIIAEMRSGSFEHDGAPLDPLRVWNKKVANAARVAGRVPGGWANSGKVAKTPQERRAQREEWWKLNGKSIHQG